MREKLKVIVAVSINTHVPDSVVATRRIGIIAHDVNLAGYDEYVAVRLDVLVRYFARLRAHSAQADSLDELRLGLGFSVAVREAKRRSQLLTQKTYVLFQDSAIYFAIQLKNGSRRRAVVLGSEETGNKSDEQHRFDVT